MKFTLSAEYKKKLEETADQVKEINPQKCSQPEFRELITFFMMSHIDELAQVKQDYANLKTEHENFKTSVDSVVKENRSLRNSMNELSTTNDTLRSDLDEMTQNYNLCKTQLNDLKGHVDSLMSFKNNSLKENAADRDRILNLERHSRGRNLRFCLKDKENDKEDTTQLIQTQLRNVGLDVHIENSHRIGKKEGNNPRQIIACFSERPQRYKVLQKRSLLFNAGIMVFEDLCAADFESKRKCKKVMQNFHNEGKKVRFARGFWWINDEKYTGLSDSELGL